LARKANAAVSDFDRKKVLRNPLAEVLICKLDFPVAFETKK